MATKIINPPSGSQAAEAVKSRYGVASAVALDTVLADCDVVDIREWRDIAIKPSVNVTTVTVHASETEDGTYVIVDNIGTNGAVTVVASKWTTLDITKIAPFGFIKLLGNVDGTASLVGKT